jgi:hypothetical protein
MDSSPEQTQKKEKKHITHFGRVICHHTLNIIVALARTMYVVCIHPFTNYVLAYGSMVSYVFLSR